MRISDWSSDVCSSDLAGPEIVDRDRDAERANLRQLVGRARGIAQHRLFGELERQPVWIDLRRFRPACEAPGDFGVAERSRERRVGNERVSRCRSRWSPYPSKKITKKDK